MYSVNWKISRIESQKCSFLQNLQLGKQTPLDNTNIDLLIGVDTIGDGEKKRDKSCSLAALKSLFGYLVNGPSMNDGSLKQVNTEAVAQRFCKKGILRNFAKFTGKRLCRNFIKKEALAQVFSCKFCEISKNTFSYRTPPVAASVNTAHVMKIVIKMII